MPAFSAYNPLSDEPIESVEQFYSDDDEELTSPEFEYTAGENKPKIEEATEAEKAAEGVYAWLKSVDVPEKLTDMGFSAEDVDKLTELAFTTPSLDGLINIGPSGNSKEVVRKIYQDSL